MPKPPLTPLTYDSAELFGPGGLVRSDLAALEPRLEAARRQVIADGLVLNLPDWLLADYRLQRSASDLGRILSTARALADRVDRIVVLGPGSATLAAEALFAGCCHPFHNELSRSERACKPRLYFVGDALDSDHLQGLLDLLGRDSQAAGEDASWAVIAIDSPDNAADLTTLEHLLAALTVSCGGNAQHVAQRLVPVTGQGSALARLAARIGSPQIFELADGAGQGDGMLSAASLLPAVLLGLDVVALLDGAAAISKHFAETLPGKNTTLDYAGAQFLLGRQNPAGARLVSIADRALLASGRWYAALLAERLSTVVHVAPPSAGQSLAAQQIASQVVLTVEIPRRDQLPAIAPTLASSDESLTPKIVGELFGTPTAQFCLRKLNEAALGQFLQMMQLATTVEVHLAGQQALGEREKTGYKSASIFDLASRVSREREIAMTTTLTWLGHASWLIESGEHTLLVDPFLNDSPTAPIKAAAVKPDFILISHGHFDHVADAAAIAVRHEATVIANYEICEWLGKQGVENTQPMNIGGGIDLPFGRVKMTIAHHSSTLPDGSSGGTAGGFLLTIAGKNLYLAGDTGLFYDMKLIGAVGLDLAVLPIGDRFTMGPDDALEAVMLLKPRRVVPSHYNTWPAIAQDGPAWAARVRQETTADAIALEPGEKIEI